MTDELLAYLLDDLSPEQRAAVEEKLATDFAWQREKARLEECLAECSDPRKCAEEPPQDLVAKTCTLVESSHDWPAQNGQHQKSCRAAAAFTAESPCCGRESRWRLADVAVGGGVMVLVALLVTPALFESRDAARRSVCQSNLERLGSVLFDYQTVRGHRLPQVDPGESAGVYTVELLEKSGLTQAELGELLLCPESQLADDVYAGRVRFVIPTRAEYESAVGDAREQMLRTLGGGYAFRIGYYENRQYQQPRFTGEVGLPLLADAPVISADGVHSGNHSRGHWVLDEALSARFRTSCVMAERRDNIYLNRDNQPAAGRTKDDIVLASGSISPDGPILPIEED